MFYVIGGVYSDTTWEKIVPNSEEKYGPFPTYKEAYAVWRSRMSWKIDDACHRLFIKENSYA